MKKLKFENKLKWTGRDFYCSRRDAFKHSMRDTYHAIDIGWLYIFFWDTKLQEEFPE